jgi:hypothetical protein
MVLIVRRQIRPSAAQGNAEWASSHYHYHILQLICPGASRHWPANVERGSLTENPFLARPSGSTAGLMIAPVFQNILEDLRDRSLGRPTQGSNLGGIADLHRLVDPADT